MQKIKFKIEYKPLSDAAISKHKDFDALMKAYVAAPKPNFIKRFLNNKWMLFSGGIISGAAITALLLTNTTHTSDTIAVEGKNEATLAENSVAQNENFIAAELLDTLEQANMNVQQNDTPVKAENENKLIAAEPEAKNAVKEQSEKQDRTAVQPAKIETPAAINTTEKAQDENVQTGVRASEKFEVSVGVDDEQQKGDVTIADNTAKVIQDQAGQQNDTDENSIDAGVNTLTEVPENTPGEDQASNDVVADNDNVKSDEPVISENDLNSENVNASEPADKDVAEKKDKKPAKTEKIKKSKEEDKQPEKKKENTATDDEKITLAEKIDGWKLFHKNEDTTTTLAENNADTLAKNDIDTTFKDRYAQLSFFTPLSTNGLDGYKYRHNVSVNILQGYNGALKGVEGAGIANIEKGYATGVQGAGVANVIGGDLTGVQGAGVFNVARNVKGVQGAGVGNLSGGAVIGVQGAGVMNIALKNVQGAQAGGVMNIALKDVQGFQAAGVINLTLKQMHGFQAAGVANVSLDSSDYLQVAGVLNVANKHSGAQIGLLNVAKNVKGCQIGLINIADTLDGASVGLISYSRNGIFDVELSTNDFFTFNAAIRTGGPRIYNIFTFGVAPLNDTMRYGYGIGIGGEIPINKLYVDIDAIGWNVHEDNFEFIYNNNFHMINQLRPTVGYKLNNYISFYAGPVLNVEIYNNSIKPFNDNPIAEYVGPNATTNLSIGYVAGVRFF